MAIVGLVTNGVEIARLALGGWACAAGDERDSGEARGQDRKGTQVHGVRHTRGASPSGHRTEYSSCRRVTHSRESQRWNSHTRNVADGPQTPSGREGDLRTRTLRGEDPSGRGPFGERTLRERPWEEDPKVSKRWIDEDPKSADRGGGWCRRGPKVADPGGDWPRAARRLGTGGGALAAGGAEVAGRGGGLAAGE